MVTKKKTSPIFWVALIGLGVAAYVFTQPEAPVTSSKKPVVKKTTKDKNNIFTEEDYKAKFEPVATPPRNVFVPVIRRGGGTLASAADLSGLSTMVTGGEAGWIYTGMAAVNGVPQALVENPRTGEAVFLKNGELWKGSTVVAITSDSLSLSAEDGSTQVARLQSNVVTPPAGGMTIPPLSVSPLSGQIGGNPGLAVEPTQTQAGNGNGNNNGNRRRRNNG